MPSKAPASHFNGESLGITRLPGPLVHEAIHAHQHKNGAEIKPTHKWDSLSRNSGIVLTVDSSEVDQDAINRRP